MTDQPDYAGVPVPPRSFLSEIRQDGNSTLTDDFIACAEWGANEQLRRCADYIRRCSFDAEYIGHCGSYGAFGDLLAEDMCRVMRPQSVSLKQEAVNELLDIMQFAKNHGLTTWQAKHIRRALEALPDD
jgi:hypothetical protein